MKRPQCWIFRNEKGAIYEVKLVQDSGVTVFPVRETTETTIKRTFRSLFGNCQFFYVQVLPDQQDKKK